MAAPIDRSVEGRASRKPDLFLSHSSRDKPTVRRLAEELAWCGIDVWLDEWELQAGESLHDVLSQAAGRAKFMATIVGGNFADSPWANDELKIGLARERHERRTLVIPIVVGRQALPAFLQDRVYIDLRKKRYEGIAKLLGLLYKIPRQTIEAAIQSIQPSRFSQLHLVLRYAGVEPKIALNKEDVQAILKSGGRKTADGCVEFEPSKVRRSPNTTPHLVRLLARIEQALATPG